MPKTNYTTLKVSGTLRGGKTNLLKNFLYNPPPYKCYDMP